MHISATSPRHHRHTMDLRRRTLIFFCYNFFFALFVDSCTHNNNSSKIYGIFMVNTWRIHSAIFSWRVFSGFVFVVVAHALLGCRKSRNYWAKCVTIHEYWDSMCLLFFALYNFTFNITSNQWNFQLDLERVKNCGKLPVWHFVDSLASAFSSYLLISSFDFAIRFEFWKNRKSWNCKRTWVREQLQSQQSSGERTKKNGKLEAMSKLLVTRFVIYLQIYFHSWSCTL